jgi:hypothetical protein
MSAPASKISDEAWAEFLSLAQEADITFCFSGDELRWEVEYAALQAAKGPGQDKQRKAERLAFLKSAKHARELLNLIKAWENSSRWGAWISGRTLPPYNPRPYDEHAANNLRKRLTMLLEAAAELKGEKSGAGRRRDEVTRSWCRSIVASLEQEGVEFRDKNGRARPQINRLICALWQLLPPQKLPRNQARTIQIVVKKVLDEREKRHAKKVY